MLKNLNNLFNKKFASIIYSFLIISLFLFVFINSSQAASLADRLSGKILLQVEKSGEAYYLNPLDKKAYYLGRPYDAFNIMRSVGLGISNADLNNFLSRGARQDLAGRILLQVEDKGQAYYIYPDNLRLHYLGRPHDAFNLMRQLGLGISNNDLQKINIASEAPSSNNTPENSPLVAGEGEKLVRFEWKYKNKPYYWEQIFSDSLYNEYKNSDKFLSYSQNNPPANLRESYYRIFLTVKGADKSLDKVISGLRRISTSENFTEDEFIEFVMAFVQYIPYDYSKNDTSEQNFPYETLYKNSGVCSDKTFLAYVLLRKIGYGAAIFDFPDIRHSAVAVLCSGQSSYNSSYCFIETTNYFPVGVFPVSFQSGQAKISEINWGTIFQGGGLGSLEIYQRSNGKSFFGMTNIINQVNFIEKLKRSILEKSSDINTLTEQLNSLKSEINALKDQLNYYKNKSDSYNYNKILPSYNSKIEEYNSILAVYRIKADLYNNDVNLFNKTVNDFFQN